MKKLNILFLLVLLLISISCKNSKITRVETIKTIQQAEGISRSLRGLMAVNKDVAWVSGTNGTVGITIDGGKNWKEHIVSGSETLDFRDIEAIDDKTAWIVSAGAPGRIYKTNDGGESWVLQYEKKENVFFDSFAFWDKNTGIVIGDPENGELFMLKTSDGGETWKQISGDNIPDPMEGEALFAASGTCIITYGKNNAWFVTGGVTAARVFYSSDQGESWKVSDSPITDGASSKGIFSVDFYDDMNGIIVGGDYGDDKIKTANAAITTDGGISWILVENLVPEGFRSCVNYVPGTKGKGLICCGTSGIDYSLDGGQSWINVNKNSYHAVSFGDSFESGWLSGGGGKIAKIVFD